MDQATLNLFYGVGSVAAVLGLIIVAFLQHHQLVAITAVLQSVNQNPALDAAIKGATEGIPQDVFTKTLSVLATLHTLAPNADQQALLDQLSELIKRVDHDPANDPKPEAPAVSVSMTVPSAA